MINRAMYSARLEDTEEGQIILVTDLYSDTLCVMTVTNDAEAVVREVVHSFGDFPIAYRDSDGRWDMLLHTEGTFTNFAPITSQAIRGAIGQ